MEAERPKTRDEWADQIAHSRTMCRGPEWCGHPEWHRLAEDWDGSQAAGRSDAAPHHG